MSTDFVEPPIRLPAGMNIKFDTDSEVSSSAEPNSGEPHSANVDLGVSPSAPPASDARIFAQTSSVGDSAAPVDKLGFELYVNALADFLVAPNTHAPLTCSIEGSWGSGKSSFMLQLKNRLKMVAPTSRTIEFNAWKYDKQEELWAAFALNLTRSLRHQTPWTRRFLGDCKLYFSRIKGLSEALKLATFALAWLFILSGAGFIFITFTQAGTNGRAAVVKQALQDLVSSKPADKPAAGAKISSAPSLTTAAQTPPTQAQMADVHDIHYWLGQSTWAGAGLIVLALLWKLPDSFRKRLFSTQIEQYIDKPDYKGKAAFLDTFSKDFARTVRAYSHGSVTKIFVFIDDLDRCEAPKAADLMQAINLMIGEGNSLIFILGLDRAKVAAAVGFKFREIVPYLDPSLDPAINSASRPASVRSFGDAFLEKFIQLSFRLPISSSEAQARTFIDSLIAEEKKPNQARTTAVADPAKPTAQAVAAAAAESARRALRIESGAESQRIRDILLMVREILEYSPRRIKTFLNAFRLALYIASAQGLLDVDLNTGEAEVNPERLGKFLVLTSRYPELRSILVEDPTFLYKIEQLTLNGETQDSEQSQTWLQKPRIRELMSFGISDKTLTRSWQRRFSMKNFPAWKFDAVLPSVPPPEEPKQTAASTPASAPSGVDLDPNKLGLDNIPNLSPEVREQIRRAGSEAIASAARGRETPAEVPAADLTQVADTFKVRGETQEKLSESLGSLNTFASSAFQPAAESSIDQAAPAKAAVPVKAAAKAPAKSTTAANSKRAPARSPLKK
jgi:hypothetical protein